jgi:hypothetical protein
MFAFKDSRPVRPAARIEPPETPAAGSGPVPTFGAPDLRQENIMKTPDVRVASVGSMMTRSMTAVGLALAIGGMSMASALGADYGDYDGQQHGPYDGYQHDQSQLQQHRMDNGYRPHHGHRWDHRDRHAYQHPDNVYRRGDY